MSTTTPAASEGEPQRLRDLKPEQFKSGLAAWLGWLFDGLDMHLFTVVAMTFVAELMILPKGDPSVKTTSSWIQAAFLVGWAVGGAFFGRIGDLIGRSRALMLTILTYAAFTGLSYFAQTWWHLLILRFLAAVGIGGEWAVGASLLSETWPKSWRPWIAATLQTAVNLGIMLAMVCAIGLQQFENYEPRWVFLIGVLPALLTVWIRFAVPEPEEWHQARASMPKPRVAELFGGSVRGITIRTILVCSLSLTAHWAFMFWCYQHMAGLDKELGSNDAHQDKVKMYALMVNMLAAIVGNYVGGSLAKRMGGYRIPIAILCTTYCLSMLGAFLPKWELSQLWWWLIPIGMSSGVFGLFTMYLPPLFPTLLRTTGAGFCYNIGRLFAAAGTIFFGLVSPVNDLRPALYLSALLFIPAAYFALSLPEAVDETPVEEPVD